MGVHVSQTWGWVDVITFTPGYLCCNITTALSLSPVEPKLVVLLVLIVIGFRISGGSYTGIFQIYLWCRISVVPYS